jgi:hypothetical protein
MGIAVVMATTAAHAAFVTTTFDASQWGASDATLGISGHAIEDFENTSLGPAFKCRD